MSRADFHRLVDGLEQQYAQRYRALSWRTALVVAIGYAGFLLWVLSIAAIGILACMGAVLLPDVAGVLLGVVGACILAAAIWQAASVLWLPGEERRLPVLKKKDAPPLNQLMKRLRKRLKTPPIHRIELSAEMNAGIQQRSRLGIFGWSQNVLHLGLPLMDLLSPAEFEAVLAHEFAHVSARHGRFGAWIYRTRSTWMQLFSRLQQPTPSSISHWARSWLGRFVDWYWPRFHAYFFVMSRMHEYAADRVAAEWSGVETAASALWKIDVASRRLAQRFWPELSRVANSQPLPPDDVSERIRDYLGQPASEEDVCLWSRQTADSVTDHSDTHPSLRDRLSSFGGSLAQCEAIGCPTPPLNSAATAFFGPQLVDVRQRVDRNWSEAAAEDWRARHHRSVSMEHRVQELENSAPQTESAASLWQRACAAVDLQGAEAAEPLLRQLLAERPNHARANLTLGRHLLERGSAEGETLLRRIIEQPDGELVYEASQVLAQHFQSTGQASALRQIHEELRRYEVVQAAANRERSAVTAQDRFLLHELSDEQLAALQSLLAQHTDLAEAYLVQKELRYEVHRPLYVLCVRTRAGWFGRSSAERDAVLVARLIPAVRLPGRVLVISPQGGFRALARKVMAGPKSRIFKAES